MAPEISKALGERFCAAPLPNSVAADVCATKPVSHPYPRYGTNLLTVAEAENMLGGVAEPVIAEQVEKAFRAGFAAAEEVLGAHGSDHLLAAIGTAWSGYADDNDFPA